MYIKGITPTNPDNITELLRYIDEQLRRLEDESINIQTQVITLEEHSVLPTKPQEGQIQRFAANIVAPATARGLYEFVGGAWVKL